MWMDAGILIIAIICNAAANIFLKMGMKEAGDLMEKGPVQMIIKVITSGYCILGLISFGIAFFAYSYVLTKMKLSIAYPIMTSGGFAIVTVAAVWLFAEQITVWRVLGIGVIALGIWIVSTF
jgi:small multidrug resistance pump